MTRINGLEILEATGIIASTASQEFHEESDTDLEDNSPTSTIRRLKVSIPLLSVPSDNRTKSMP